MVRNDSVGSVNAILVFVSELAGIVPRPGQLLNLGEDGREDIGIVVGRDVVEDGDEPLEAHTGVDVLVGKGAERAGRFTVVLDEDVVPDLEDVWVVGVDQLGDGAATDTIKVDLAAWTAWSAGAHLCRVSLSI